MKNKLTYQKIQLLFITAGKVVFQGLKGPAQKNPEGPTPQTPNPNPKKTQFKTPTQKNPVPKPMEMRKNTKNNPGKKQAVMVDKQRVNHNSKDFQISNWPIILMAICDHYKRQGRFCCISRHYFVTVHQIN